MSEVLVVEADGVLEVTINRPEARNAMTKSAAEAIAPAMDRLDAEAHLRCAILTGAGGTFCSGMDLKGFLTGELPVAGNRGFGGLTSWTPKKPVIAAVDGYALAGGFELALSCDLIVANRKAKFGMPGVKRGLVAGGGGAVQLPRLLPRPLAMEMVLTGDPLDAERAFALGPKMKPSLVKRPTSEMFLPRKTPKKARVLSLRSDPGNGRSVKEPDSK